MRHLRHEASSMGVGAFFVNPRAMYQGPLTMPKGLHLINSNHMEVLASALAEVLGTPPGKGSADAFQPDIVLVQSKGMQRWISMAVAQANGICANVQFPFPNAFIQQLCGVVKEAAQATGAYEKEVLTFRIFHLLPGLLDHTDFDPLSRYLATDDRPIKRYQLCRKLADMLDQYAVFRPDWLFAWEEERGGIEKLPETQRWQAHLCGVPSGRSRTVFIDRHFKRGWWKCSPIQSTSWTI